jgi:pilus assembly protein Flp/PilA
MQMATLKSKTALVFAREDGATMVEYGLMVALIAVVAVSAVGVLGGNVSETFSELTF